MDPIPPLGRLLFRRAHARDAAALSTLAAATFTETFGHLYAREDLLAFLSTARSEAVYRALLQSSGVGIWLASTTQQTAPVGYAVAGPCKLPVADLESQAGEVRELYVLSSAQGHKVGTQLLAGALEWLEAQGRLPVYVGVWSGNQGAQRLYARFGFHKIGEYDFPVGQHVDREYILKR